MQRAVVATVAVLLPVVLAGNGIYALVHPWFVRFEYGRDGFPRDPYGMPTEERTRLALVGLRSIVPWERAGTAPLGTARLTGGEPAFTPREIAHMSDVRRLLLVLLVVHAATLVALVALAAARRTRRLAVRALAAGAVWTLALFALVGFLLLVDPDWFLTGFHSIFFEGSSWRFGDRDTLRRLFPDRFWDDTALLLGAGAAGQAVAILVLTRRRALATALRAPRLRNAWMRRT